MKKISTITAILAALLQAGLPAHATNYLDATVDFTSGTWGDLTSVDVNNDATTLTFKINTAGTPDLVANTWHHYYIGISTGVHGPTGGNLNTTSYGRNIQMSTGGMDFALLSYPAFNGYDRFATTTGSTMTFSGTGVTSWDASGVTITASLASLGLIAGNTLKFDVWSSTSGSDNTVLDALSDTTARGFNGNPFDTGANALSYTITSVPEPAAMTMLGAGFAMLLVRRFRARQ